jgi:DNA-binding response OmpR family regulator
MGANPRLVLIEDNPADVLLVRQAIRERGMKVDLVSYPDVPDALAGLLDPESPVPDAILIDLNLPKGDGLNIIKVLSASPRLAMVPLGILTSSQSPRDIQEAQELKIGSYIHKPSTLDEFLLRVGVAIAQLLGIEKSDSQCA